MKYFTSSLLVVSAASSLTPVVLVPGIAGSRLKMKLTDADLPECSDKPYSQTESDLWIDPINFLPGYSRNCWKNKATLNWNEEIKQFESPNGIEVYPDDFGSTHGINYMLYIMGIGAPLSDYWATAVSHLKKKGYKERQNLFGAPYDWRRAPNEINWAPLKQLIEDAYFKNGSLKVTIVGHSMGTLYMTYFLNKVVNQEWKDKFISQLTLVAPALGGSPKVVKGLLSGYNDELVFDLKVFKIAMLDELFLRDLFRVFGSFYALWPQEEVYGDDASVISFLDSSTNETIKSFSPKTVSTILPPEMAERLKHIQSQVMNDVLVDPGVPVSCMWSLYDHPTTDVTFTYSLKSDEQRSSNEEYRNAAFFDNQPSAIYGKGDHMLPLAALSYCTKWSSTYNAVEFHNLEHYKIVNDKNFLNVFDKMIQNSAHIQGSKEQRELQELIVKLQKKNIITTNGDDLLKAQKSEVLNNLKNNIANESVTENSLAYIPVDGEVEISTIVRV